MLASACRSRSLSWVRSLTSLTTGATTTIMRPWTLVRSLTASAAPAWRRPKKANTLVIISPSSAATTLRLARTTVRSSSRIPWLSRSSDKWERWKSFADQNEEDKKMTQAEFNALKRNEYGYLVIPDCTNCTEIDFNRIDRIEFGKYCKLGNGCELGDWCRLGYGCKLGNDCELGDQCELGNRCKLGYGCKLGNRCKLGDGCELGDGCKLGVRCKLGEYIDVRATFEEGRVVDGLYVQIGNIGSEHRTAYFYIDKNGAMFVRAGCWFSDLIDFKARVKDVHGGTIYEAQYMAACAYAETVLPLMLKKSDAAREAGKTNDND
nr:MAG TPA: hypothetical protein [Caudoviricetes sp.]